MSVENICISPIQTIHEGNIPLHRGITYQIYSAIGDMYLNPEFVGNLCRQASTTDILLMTQNSNFEQFPKLSKDEEDFVRRNFDHRLIDMTGDKLGALLYKNGVSEELIDPILENMPPGLTFSVQSMLKDYTNLTCIVRRFPYSTDLPYMASIAVSPAQY